MQAHILRKDQMTDQQQGALHLIDENFEQKVKEAGKPVMVDFYAEWCGPCQMAAPIIDQLADEYRDKIEIVKVNVDENRDTAGKYAVMSIPTVVILKVNKDGAIEELNRQVGFPGEDGFRKMIEAVIA